MKNHTETYRDDPRDCDFCAESKVTPTPKALYDGRTTFGQWANMCENHFRAYGVGLGLGKGQKLVDRPETG